MQLPVVNSSAVDAADQSIDALARIVKKASTELTATFAKRADLDGAVAFANASLPSIEDANFVHEARIPAGKSAREVFDEVESFYRPAGAKCLGWVGAARTIEPELRAILESVGFSFRPESIMVIRKSRASATQTPTSATAPPRPTFKLQIIPARAALPAYRAFRRDVAAHDESTDIADAVADCDLAELDDNRLDMIAVLDNSRIIAAAGVMALGDTGVIWNLAVHPSHRNHGLAAELLHRLLDLCARAQFRTLALAVEPDNHAAIRLYESIGMETLGQYDRFLRRP